MPEHTSFISYFIAMFPTLGQNMHAFGTSIQGHPVGEHQAEPMFASVFVALIVIALAVAGSAKMKNHDQSVIPDDKLTLRTFWELFVGYFYEMMKEMMGPKRAKRYFPFVGTCAVFIFFSNVLGMIPGFLPPTATLSVTAACGISVLFAFTYYGLKEQGFGFISHLFGPWLGPIGIPINILLFGIEFLSTFIIRPVTISIRLMLNIAVDHLLLSVFLGLIPFILPIPVMILGTLVTVVQVLVFCLLASIYIALATEGHGDHGDDKHGHEGGHGKAPAAAH